MKFVTPMGMGILALTAGCALSHPRSDGGVPLDARPPSDSASDVRLTESRDVPVCVPEAETCDGRDEDCDGAIDDGAPCELPRASSECVAGGCRVASCEPGFGDCNGEPSDGCETATSDSRSHCGGCGITCPVSALCEAGTCVREVILDVEPQLEFTVALLASGRIVAWGEGIPLPSGERIDSLVPVEIEGAPPASLMTSTGTAIFVVNEGRLYAWGRNDSGELAQGFVSAPAESLPVTEIPFPRPIVMIAGGASRWVVAADDREVAYYWGARTADGMILAEGTSPRSHDLADSGWPMLEVFVAGDSLMARFDRGSGGIFWGFRRNYLDGQENGDGEWSAWSPLIGPFGETDCSRTHCCTGRTFAAMECWGRQVHGCLGQPDVPEGGLENGALVAGLVTPEVLRDVATSDLAATCVIREDGTLWCWGSADGNGLGDTVDAPVATRVELADPRPLTGLRSGVNLCAIVDDTGLLCWGDNTHGGIGNGARGEIIRRPSPVVAFE